MYHPFSIADTLKAAWSIFKKQFVTIIVYSVATFFIVGILVLTLGIFIKTDNYYVGLLVSLIIVAFYSYTTLGLYKLIFTLIDRDIYEFEIKQIFPRFTMLVSFMIIAFIFIAIYVAYSMMLTSLKSIELLQDVLIYIGAIGCFYLVSRGLFSICYILDDDSGPIESVKQSFKLTRDHFLHTTIILIISVLLIAVPAQLARYFIWAPLLLIFSYPYVNILLMVAYRKLVYSNKDVDDLETETV